ncbi:MAG TPA: hypothetical protein VFQ39_17735 [Longimicrobium sp.]|nr:hypothetical protein [Longimicrobium sp.]
MTPLARRLRCLLLALALLLPVAAAAQIPPDARWRTFNTPHFRVRFTEGLDSLAARAGARAETAYALLADSLVRPPSGRIDLLVTDNVDYANGFATPFPRNRVVVFAHPPVDDPSLAYYEDWMELVITHELTHIFQLDYASGPLRWLRALLGRNPITFPEVNTPSWTKEGLAVYAESRLTRAGRLRGTMHEMAIRTAVLEDDFFSIDRASGDPASWPAGNTSYVYGSEFLQWLSDKYDRDGAGEFVERYGAQLVPYLVDRAAKRAYGIPFSRAWREWEDSLRARYAVEEAELRRQGLTEPEILTEAGRRTEFPRWSPDGRRIAYSTSTGREETSTRVIEADGSITVLSSRTTLGPSSWAADGRSLLTSMLEATDPYRYYADLFRVDAGGGRDRVTRDARLWEPDVARDGRVVAIRSERGTNVPVVMEDASADPVGARVLATPSLDVHWATPRWSPDGRRIAISRWRAGGYYDVVILDAETGRIEAEATSDRAVDLAPTWSPDGRYLLFSSDRTGIANLHAFEVATGRLRQVTNVLTGAFQPDVSPDGRWIAFALYRADGYHVARIPFDPSSWRDAPPVREEPGRVPAPASLPETRRYSPWRTLLPTAWNPVLATDDVLGTAFGASIAGSDVVERHSWGASALVWSEEARFQGGIGWLYRGLGNPVLGASAFQDWDVLGEAGRFADDDGNLINSALLERERSTALVATFTRPRFRSNHGLSAGASNRQRDRVWEVPSVAPEGLLVDLPPEVGGAVTLGLSTMRAYDFSISREDGLLAAAQVEGRRFTRALEGRDDPAGYLRATGRLQAYQSFAAWGFARHVLAARVAVGADAGSRAPGYALGGEGGFGAGSPLGTGIALGDELDFPVRGYPSGAQFGDRAVAATAEYRFPIALVERGLGLLPVYLDRLWGTAFADGGAAWCVEFCEPVFVGLQDEPRPLYSVGVELGGDVTLGYILRMRLRGGVAVPLSEIDRAGGVRERPSPEFYFTFGQSF